MTTALFNCSWKLGSPSKSPFKKRANLGEFKDSGVKKLMILAIAFDVKENYANIKLVFDTLQLNDLKFTLAADLKLLNIIVGIQSHSSMFPCTWCEGTSPFEAAAPQRTLARIKGLVSSFRNSGSTLAQSKTFFNCINMPLIQAQDKAPILETIPPTELHLMLGVTNHIFDKLNKHWGDDKAYKWANENSIVRAEYRGGSLEGNQCKKLLEKSGKLAEELPSNFRQYAFVLQQFNLVRKPCFGKVLDSNYQSHIHQFEQMYRKLDISVTPKAHCVFQHVIQFCSQKNLGLGVYSEQASESVHHDFAQVWERYKREPNHPSFQEQLKSAVVKYNTLHV